MKIYFLKFKEEQENYFLQKIFMEILKFQIVYLRTFFNFKKESFKEMNKLRF
jgi:hypothetical protein